MGGDLIEIGRPNYHTPKTAHFGATQKHRIG